MLRFTLSAFLILAPFALAQTQAEMNLQAKADFERADRELNQAYSKLQKASADVPGYQESLKTAQRLWVQFRDASAESECFLSQGGSVYPLCYSMALTNQTQKRTADLKQMLKEWDRM
jgi:uncharacterized protein YecT (DUF1311 family)